MSNVQIPKAVLRRAADALRYQARAEAGMSQAPDLITAEDTQEWKDAQAIDAAVAGVAA